MTKFDPIAYFLDIAKTHKEIAHSDENKAFFREFSASKVVFNITDFFTHQRKHSDVILIIQFNDDGNITGPNSDSHFKNNYISVYLFTKVKHNHFAEMEAANAKLNSIFDDIFAKLRSDRDKDYIPFMFDLNKISLNSLGIIGDSYYGLLSNMQFSEPYNPITNVEKWISN